MRLLGKLPIGGNGSYEHNFHVNVRGRGLDAIVEKAVSGGAGEYALGRVQAGSPLTGIRVTLKTSVDTMSLGKYGSINRPAYALEAVLGSDATRPSLPVNLGVLREAGFSVGSKEKRNSDSVTIYSGTFLPHAAAGYSPVSGNGHLRYSLVAAGLTREDVGRTVTRFARALEAVVNGVYKAARQDSPATTLHLKLGGQVRKVGAQTVVGGTTGRRHAEISNATGEPQETPPISLEAIRSEVTFKNIGGYKGVKAQLGDFLLAIKNPEEARRHGYMPSKGWLLHGPPGTGKTLFGKALAGEAGAEFVYFNAADVLQMYVGQSTKALKAAFEGAQERAGETKKPVILFIDEIDSIFPNRGTAHDVKVDLVNLFNQYMDGFESRRIPNVYVVAATNRLHEMDESATRAGRFVKIEVPLPDLEARVAIFQVTKAALEREAGNQLFNPGIDYRPLAERSEKFSGADIAQVMREARQKAFRQAATAKQKAVVMTTAADLEAQIKYYRRQKQGSSGGSMGFRTGG